MHKHDENRATKQTPYVVLYARLRTSSDIGLRLLISERRKMQKTVKSTSEKAAARKRAVVCSEKPLACVCGPNSTSYKWFCFALPAL